MKLRSGAAFGLHLLLRYLLACFFSLLLYVSLSFFFTSFWIQLIHFICSIAILYMLLYQFSWEQGNFDANHVTRGDYTASENRGLTAGLFPLILPVAVFALGLLARFSILPDGFFHLQNLLNPPFFAYVCWLFASVQPYTTEAGTGTALVMCAVQDAAWYGFILQLLPALTMPFVCWLGYKLGRKRVLLTDKVVYRTPEQRAEQAQKRIRKDDHRGLR